MQRSFTISVVIPNWNGARLLEKNLPKVRSAVGSSAEIIVVDDGSTDDSDEILRRQFPEIKRIHISRHRGFASSVNMGVAEAVGDIVVLINTDVIPQKDFLKPLLVHFRNERVFAVGCMDKSIEGDTVVLRGRGEAKWEKGFFVHWRGEVNQMTTAWVSGGSGAFRKSMWQELGGMDSLFDPFYWEDIDLSYRARQKEYLVVFEPKSIVAHHHEQGGILNSYSPLSVQIISYRNQFTFIWKHIRGFDTVVQHAFWTPIRLMQSLLHRDVAMLIGYGWALLRLPTILARRAQNR